MLGIISDTHDNLGAIRKAVDFFNSQKVELVLHAGDFVAPFTAREFKNLNCKLVGVFGNNDGDKDHLRENYSSQMGTELKELQILERGGKKICLYHGTQEEFVEALANSEEYEVVVRGHSHEPEIKKVKETLIINPGEAGGHLSGKKTVALLDLENLEGEIFELK